jgi:hypothetical protein
MINQLANLLISETQKLGWRSCNVEKYNDRIQMKYSSIGSEEVFLPSDLSAKIDSMGFKIIQFSILNRNRPDSIYFMKNGGSVGNMLYNMFSDFMKKSKWVPESLSYDLLNLEIRCDSESPKKDRIIPKTLVARLKEVNFYLTDMTNKNCNLVFWQDRRISLNEKRIDPTNRKLIRIESKIDELQNMISQKSSEANIDQPPQNEQHNEAEITLEMWA